MPARRVEILLTGLPGCGKTTAIVKIVNALGHENASGFYTREIREGRIRKGFGWERLDGAAGTLAHVDIRSRFTVGKYGVDVSGFENDVVSVLDAGRNDAALFVVDEIGKMECFSKKFVSAIRGLFQSEKSLLATVARKGSGLISEVKEYPGIELTTLTHDNRDAVVTEITERLSLPGK